MASRPEHMGSPSTWRMPPTRSRCGLRRRRVSHSAFLLTASAMLVLGHLHRCSYRRFLVLTRLAGHFLALCRLTNHRHITNTTPVQHTVWLPTRPLRQPTKQTMSPVGLFMPTMVLGLHYIAFSISPPTTPIVLTPRWHPASITLMLDGIPMCITGGSCRTHHGARTVTTVASFTLPWTYLPGCQIAGSLVS